MPTLYAPTTQNAIQKTLDASLDAGVTAAATFNNMTGVQNLPGVFVVDRVDSNGVETPSKREYISFATTSGSNVQTLVRGLAGSTDQDHAVGAIVEFIPDVTWAQDLRDHLTTEHNTDGTHSDIHADSIELGGSGATVTGIIDDDTFATASATTLATSESTKAYVDANAGSSDGWIDPGVTYTYASASSFTITGVDKTAVFTKGTKIKLTQSTGGTKYFYVTSSSFSTNTTVNITAGNVHTLANEAITAPYYSYQTNPQGFPTVFTWTPSFGGFSSAPSSPVARFSIVGTVVYLNIMTGNGTSNANTFTISLPVVAKTVSGVSWRNRMSNLVDNNTNSTTIDFSFIDSGASSVAIAKNFSTVGFTTSGNKGAELQVFYEI